VAAGRVGKADEDEELEVFPGVESSLEWESKKLVMGAWKRRRLVIDSMMIWGGKKGARLGDCWSRSRMGIPRADQCGGGSDVFGHATVVQGEFVETVMEQKEIV